MAVDPRKLLVFGIAIYLFSRYYLEREYEREVIFWFYSSLSALFGLLSAYTVVGEHPSRAFYIPLTALFIALAILYHPVAEEGVG